MVVVVAAGAAVVGVVGAAVGLAGEVVVGPATSGAVGAGLAGVVVVVGGACSSSRMSKRCSWSGPVGFTTSCCGWEAACKVGAVRTKQQGGVRTSVTCKVGVL